MGFKIEPYAPCPCGSGKKYKFCCYLKRDEGRNEEGVSSFFEKEPDYPDFNDNPEVYQLFKEGLRLMNKTEFRAAIPHFQKAVAINPLIYSPANNLALCLFATGQLNEAIQVQSECLETNPLQNPFGLSNLTAFYYIKGDNLRARRFLKKAMNADIPSNDACVKVCETIARFKLHKDILDFVSTTAYANDPIVCFYTGVASANLGDREQALNDLQKVPAGYFKAPMIRRYLEHLRSETEPNTVKSDWPYLYTYEICPLKVVESMISSGDDLWKDLPVLVDFCESSLNEMVEDTEAPMKILSELEHPAATELLWTIVKGSYGPDSLRFEALNILKMNNLVGKEESVEVLADGERREISLKSTFLNPEFRFGKLLPPKQDKTYIKVIGSMQKKTPDWKFIDKTLLSLMKDFPDFYPASYNYAIALLRRGNTEKAKPIVQKLVDKHPEYLFARCTLLQIYLNDDQPEAAEELITTMPEIDETHPDAMATWMAGQAFYFEFIEDDERAFRCIQSAHDISPDLQIVNNLWQQYSK